MMYGYLTRTFDMLNVGDLDLIAQARRLCDRLVLGVYTDEYAQRALGRLPVVPLEERLSLVRHLRDVHGVIVHDGGSVQSFGDCMVSDCVVFTVGDRGGHPPDAIVLTPARETSSWILSEALRVVREVSVA